MPAVPAGATDSVDHETPIVDYEVTAVPGFGTLHAGVDATAAQRAAALDDAATILFFRVKDSYATRVVEKKRVTINDLYVDYLTGTVRVCPDGAPSTSSKCHDVVPLEYVTLPAGCSGLTQGSRGAHGPRGAHGGAHMPGGFFPIWSSLALASMPVLSFAKRFSQASYATLAFAQSCMSR